ncbi:MAG TPA: hypothetical protein VGC41_16885, partial [Kofleriaceae bacterium]
MIRWAIALVLVVLGCNGADRREPEQVPSTYQTVRASAGHTMHVGKVACAACHGDAGFAPPPPGLCATCHAGVMAPLHRDREQPGCQDCHGFGPDKAITPTNCMRCHDKPQSTVHAVGAHRDQPCATCHHAHRTPSLDPKPCTQCHVAETTKHAGTRGCLDCHRVHE